MPTYPTATPSYITYPVGPTTATTTLTANASSNTKGSFVEYVASSPFATTALQIMADATTNNIRLFLFDVATGAAASEVVVIADLALAHYGTVTGATTGLWSVPLAIATATRLSARCQCSTGSNTLNMSLSLLSSNGAPGLTSTTTVGVNTSTSAAVQIDPGGTVDTKGSYSEITSSTAAVYQWLMLMGTNWGHGTVSSGVLWCVDVATGAAASEVVLIPDLRLRLPTTWAIPGPVSYSFLSYVAASTRLAVRASASINTATNRLFDAAIVFGVAPAESSGAGAVLASPPAVFVTPTMAGY